VIDRIEGIEPADFKYREIGSVKRAAHGPFEARSPRYKTKCGRAREGGEEWRELLFPGRGAGMPAPQPSAKHGELGQGRVRAARQRRLDALDRDGAEPALAPKQKLYEFAGSGGFVPIHSAMCSRSVSRSVNALRPTAVLPGRGASPPGRAPARRRRAPCHRAVHQVTSRA
jgi:hypothetical protein